MKRFTHLRSKKGFSLVELIIVIAIMVALVAVTAPTYVKYVTKARNAALRDAAEECMAYAKSCFGMELTGRGSIWIGVEKNHISVKFDEFKGENTLTYVNEAGEEGIEAFKKDLNFRDGVISQSTKAYFIRIDSDDVALSTQEVDFYIEEASSTEEL